MKNYAVLALFLLPVMSGADPSSQKILCPLLEVVKNSAEQLDTAMKVKDKYITYTSSSFFQSDNIWWFSGAGNISASSAQEAVMLGKAILQKADVQMDIYASKVGSEFICNYGPGYIQARGKNLG